MIIKKNGNAPDPVPAGNHVARCIQIVDMGTQKSEWQGKVKFMAKVRLTWELPEVTKEFKEGEGEKPYLIAKTYTASMHEKAALSKDLESWRGKAFTDEERAGFDLKNVLGKPCLLNVIHETKDGNTYANIASISQVPKGMTVKPAVNPIVEFSLAEFSQSAFDALPDFLKEKIRLSPEYAHATSGAQQSQEHYSYDEIPDVF